MKNKKKLRKGQWTKQALRVLEERYLIKDSNGQLIETPEEMCWRVSLEIAGVEKKYGADKKKVNDLAEEFYDLMINRYFFPNSPTLMNAGRDVDLQYSACFVLPVEDSIESIFNAVKNAALVHQSGGGTGFSFSRLRPKSSRVKKSGGVASGPVSFMRVFDSATEQVKQGGRRRGANMGVLRVDHPDIEEFIDCKLDGGITNFNISVGITEDFMKALGESKDYYFKAGANWPKASGGHYKKSEKISKKSAEEIFSKIVNSAHQSGDPGIIWLDRINKGAGNPVSSMGPVEATNPCGEQPLYPNEACNLGSVNLGLMTKPRGRGYQVDWEKLEGVVKTAARFLDNVIDVNPFPLEKIREAVLANRRIGLGVMGWADLLFKLRIPYDSSKAVRLARKVMKFINNTAWRQSEKIAKQKGPFPNFKKSIYKHEKPKRNATVTTIAPTGSISIIANCSSGIEPVFALAFTHKSGDRVLYIMNTVFEEIVSRYKNGKKIINSVKEKGNLGDVDFVSDRLKNIFKTAHEINWSWHIKMQAAFQKYVDNAVSKTINLPNSATIEDVRKAYLMAYKQGCMGITIFRDGCKCEQVLTGGVKKRGKKTKFVIKSRPDLIKGSTYRIITPVGTAFITINHNGEIDQPLEVFVTVGKAGSDVTADAEAIGRLISLCLRIASPGLSQKQIAQLIIDQLRNIGGGNSVGFGEQRVRSLADGVAKVLKRHIEKNGSVNQVEKVSEQQVLQGDKKQRDICPECGDATLVLVEGCAKCLSCGFSKC